MMATNYNHNWLVLTDKNRAGKSSEFDGGIWDQPGSRNCARIKTLNNLVYAVANATLKRTVGEDCDSGIDPSNIFSTRNKYALEGRAWRVTFRILINQRRVDKPILNEFCQELRNDFWILFLFFGMHQSHPIASLARGCSDLWSSLPQGQSYPVFRNTEYTVIISITDFLQLNFKIWTHE